MDRFTLEELENMFESTVITFWFEKSMRWEHFILDQNNWMALGSGERYDHKHLVGRKATVVSVPVVALTHPDVQEKVKKNVLDIVRVTPEQINRVILGAIKYSTRGVFS